MWKNVYYWLTEDFNVLKASIWIVFTSIVFAVLPIWLYQVYFITDDRWSDVLENIEIVGMLSVAAGIFFLWFLFIGRIKHGKVER